MAEEIKKSTVKKPKKRDYSYAVGRRKESVARIRLYSTLKENQKWKNEELKKGQILVNELPIEKYFSGPIAKAIYTKPLVLTNTLDKYAITVKVAGGGKQGQLEALVHALSRCLSSINKEKHRPALKKAGLLTRNPKVRERRKVGTGGKARRRKQSPKR